MLILKSLVLQGFLGLWAEEISALNLSENSLNLSKNSSEILSKNSLNLSEDLNLNLSENLSKNSLNLSENLNENLSTNLAEIYSENSAATPSLRGDLSPKQTTSLKLENAKISQANSLDINASGDERVLLNSLKSTLLAAKIYESKQWRLLLHYEGEKSSIQKDSTFFLSKNGYKSPKDEYLATIESFFDELDFNPNFTPLLENLNAENSPPSLKNLNAENLSLKNDKISSNSPDSNTSKLDNSTLCLYPARLDFIAQNLQDENYQRLFKKLTQTKQCRALNEFLAIVPVDEILLEFAAESEIYPGSAMGHIFLHLRGRVREDIDTTISGVKFSRAKGDTQDYAMSYFALFNENFSPIDYLRAFNGTLAGAYALNPYENAQLDYLENEARSIYVFAVRAQSAAVRRFALHLWELKDRAVAYDFITHNCTNGVQNILAVLDSEFMYDGAKPFTTPLEYIQHLQKRGKIALVETQIPPKKQKFTRKFGQNEVLKTRKASKIALGGVKKGGFIYLAPIYSDIKNANYAYKELIEARLFSVEARLTRQEKTRIFAHKIELLRLFSVGDTFRAKSLSKLINIELSSNLYERKFGEIYGTKFNDKTRLYPTLEFGGGLGVYALNMSFYSIAKLGYRYESIHNAFLSLKSGVVTSFERARLLAEHEIYYDFNDNNRGYDNKFSLYAAFNAFSEIDIFAEFNAYHNFFSTQKISYERDKSVNFRAGVSVNF